jgi:hypothetical protein
MSGDCNDGKRSGRFTPSGLASAGNTFTIENIAHMDTIASICELVFKPGLSEASFSWDETTPRYDGAEATGLVAGFILKL